MSNRRKEAPRCERCKMLVQGCVCALMPQVATRTRLLVLLHKAEAKKPTNTGRLAALCLPNSEVLVRGLPGQAPDLSALAGKRALVLAPDDEAKIIEHADDDVVLVVPDGSWRQAAKMPRREPLLRDLQRVKLPPVLRRAPSLRLETKDNGFATFVAIAHALGILEDPAIERTLLTFYDVVVERILRARAGQP